jgi:hypothetical protein
MSVWSSLKGVVSIHKKAKVSIKDVAREVFDCDDKIVIGRAMDTEHVIGYNIQIEICLSGNEAVSRTNRFIDRLKYSDPKVRIDLELTARFFESDGAQS